MRKKSVQYFTRENVSIPSRLKIIISRLAFPVLALLSREQTLKLGLIPIDDERVIMAMKYAKGRVLDIGCGANIFVKSYGNGVGVDVYPWKGCDKVIKDAAKLPFKDQTFNTVSYLACLNHIHNRDASVKDAYRVLGKRGQILVTMINPKLGAFIHWLRFRNDPDHHKRNIDHYHELLGMSEKQVISILKKAGFKNIQRIPFVFSLNNLYIAKK